MGQLCDYFVGKDRGYAVFSGLWHCNYCNACQCGQLPAELVQ